MLKKCLLPLFLVVTFVFSLLAGCTININIGAPSANIAEETTILESNSNPKTMYESRATILITNNVSSDAAISSSDLMVPIELVNSYAVILKSNVIQNQIREEYPGSEYELSLEQIDETEIFALIATSETPEYLEDICNRATSLLCEKIPQVIEGSSCKIVDFPHSVQEVGTN